MSIMSCRGFKRKKSTVILTCPSALVSCYIFKVFVNVETRKGGLYNVPSNVPDKINSVVKRDNYSVLTYKTSIPYIVNTLNNIYIPRQPSIFQDEQPLPLLQDARVTTSSRATPHKRHPQGWDQDDKW